MSTTLYIDKAFLSRVTNIDLVGDLGQTKVDQAISSACGVADDYLGKRYEMPLVTWTDGLRLRVGQIAVYLAMSAEGFNPEGDTIIRTNYEDAIAWLAQIAAAKIDPDLTDSSPGAVEQPSAPRASMRSASSRGFDHISDASVSRNRFGSWS